MRIYLLTFCSLLFFLTSCASIHTPGNGQIPPGQAKKIDGQKSAKEYAPGQQKKNKNRSGEYQEFLEYRF